MASPLSNSSLQSRMQHRQLPMASCIIGSMNGGLEEPAAAAAAAATNCKSNMNGKLRRLYLEFLNEMRFANSAASCNPVQLETICSRIAGMCHSVPPNVIVVGALIAEMCYRYHPIEQQVKIAHFTALLTFLDDLGGLQGEERQRLLEDFNLTFLKLSDPQGYAKLYPGRGELHPTCEDAIVFFRSEQSPFYGTDQWLHSQLLKSFFDFLHGTMLEEHYRENPLELGNASPASGHEMALLPTALRRKTGIAEPYACFILMNTAASCRSKQEESFFYSKFYPLVPEMTAVIEYINDVLSFYKELDNGEHDGCIFSDAKVHGLSTEEALEIYAQYCVDGRRRIMAIVDKAESAEMKRKMVQFFQGYMAFHLGSRRYRMKEVLPDSWYNGDIFG